MIPTHVRPLEPKPEQDRLLLVISHGDHDRSGCLWPVQTPVHSKMPRPLLVSCTLRTITEGIIGGVWLSDSRHIQHTSSVSKSAYQRLHRDAASLSHTSTADEHAHNNRFPRSDPPDELRVLSPAARYCPRDCPKCRCVQRGVSTPPKIPSPPSLPTHSLPCCLHFPSQSCPGFSQPLTQQRLRGRITDQIFGRRQNARGAQGAIPENVGPDHGDDGLGSSSDGSVLLC